MTGNERHFTTLDLDQLELGEIEATTRRSLEDHIIACRDCAARRFEHKERQEHFRRVVFPRTIAALGARRWQRPTGLWAFGLALPVVTGLLFVAWGLDRGRQHAGTEPSPGAAATIGVKGDTLFQVFARRGRSARAADESPVVRVADGTRLAPGDALRFVLYPTGLPYVLIASVDGAGQVNIYYPFHGDSSALVDGQSAVSVPGSIVLDGAPGPERLFVIYSDQPVQARAVRQVLERTAAGRAPAIRAAGRLPFSGTVQTTLLFEKEGAR
jgi:hypothetical protein